MKKLMVGMVGLAGTAAALWLGPGAGARSASSAPTYETAVVVRRDMDRSVKATGIIRPVVGAEVRVGSRLSGVVRRLPVQIGDRVTAGQILAELEDSELTARRDQAVAALEVARAELDYARTDWERKQALAQQELLAAAELDLAQRALAVARRRQEQAQADLDYALTQLGQTRIRAPLTGVVAAVAIREGETVTAMLGPTFVTLIDLDRLEVWAYVDETDVGRVRPGQTARFTVDTYADQHFEGRVHTIHPQAEVRDNVVNYVAVVQFQTPPGYVLRPEMTTTVRIALERRTGVLVVPRKAVRHEGGQRFVYGVQGGERVRRRVQTGWRDERYWQIVKGLEEGEQVVVGELAPDARG